MRLVKLVHYPHKYDSRIIHWSYYGLTEKPVKSQLFCSIYKLAIGLKDIRMIIDSESKS